MGNEDFDTWLENHPNAVIQGHSYDSENECKVDVPIQELLQGKLTTALSVIIDTSNYHAMFGRTLEMCTVAHELNRVLFEIGGISDEEYCANNRRIEEAKNQMIVTHGQWVAQFLEKRKDRHTVQTLVSSVYHDIFGIEIKE